jgi:hypothetical protein
MVIYCIIKQIKNLHVKNISIRTVVVRDCFSTSLFGADLFSFFFLQLLVWNIRTQQHFVLTTESYNCPYFRVSLISLIFHVKILKWKQPQHIY